MAESFLGIKIFICKSEIKVEKWLLLADEQVEAAKSVCVHESQKVFFVVAAAVAPAPLLSRQNR